MLYAFILFLHFYRDITHGCEDVPIRCVNDIDDEVPIEFTYIKENCYDVGNYVDSAMSHIAVSYSFYFCYTYFSIKIDTHILCLHLTN